ncbi:aspartic proteinase Asp1-like isoform X2 [Tripterygium wilfordii]|uniref:aspartic proteinase Asp1-like isoform X2 n=1 Tax=Tripterygium wilfordii TaxID=458696 RepID=UPI0018F85A1D|nr:aspartic proteinase Asp1-like isoform X2 [Tripterygium wilfordii]
MKKGKLGWGLGVLVVLMLILESSTSSRGVRWRKAMQHQEREPLMVPNRVGVSSVMFPLHGNVYPTGYYNVTIQIGQPQKPYFLDVDTGSDLTWLQCDAPCIRCMEAHHPYYRPNNDLLSCNDPLCKSLQSNGGNRCDSGQCDYEVEYADGGSSLGVLVRDVFPLNFTNGAQARPHLSLGCGYKQSPDATNHPLDGILGLGRGKTSIISQLSSQGFVRNVVGHCLSSRGGGYLFFGDDIYDSSHVTWTALSQEHPKHYSPGYAELYFGGRTTGYKNLFVTFDSGSSYTYFNSEAYQGLVYLVKKDLHGQPLKEVPDDQTLPLCWKGHIPFQSIHDVENYFKPFALRFTNGGESKSTLFEFTPETHLIISSKGNVCMGILNGTEVGLGNLNLIGDISMQDRMVIYDNEKQMMGWEPADCDSIPKSTSSILW